MKLLIDLYHKLSFWSVLPRQIEIIRLKFPNIEIIDVKTDRDVEREIIDAEIFCSWHTKDHWLEKAGKLKWLATPAAGLEWFVCPKMLEIDAVFTNGAYHGKIISEHVIGMMLFFERQLGDIYVNQKKVPWRLEEVVTQMGSLRGKTMLIIGAGNIGKQIARKARAFHMHIIGIKRHLDVQPKEFDEIHGREALEDCLSRADHVALALPGNHETDRIIGAAQFKAMKPTAYIYNVGRGNSIDEKALADALKKGTIAGAGLDVFEREPLPMETPLRQFDNIILSPHASAIAPIYLDLAMQEFVQNIERYLSGKKLLHIISKENIKRTLDRKKEYSRLDANV